MSGGLILPPGAVWARRAKGRRGPLFCLTTRSSVDGKVYARTLNNATWSAPTGLPDAIGPAVSIGTFRKNKHTVVYYPINGGNRVAWTKDGKTFTRLEDIYSTDISITVSPDGDYIQLFSVYTKYSASNANFTGISSCDGETVSIISFAISYLDSAYFKTYSVNSDKFIAFVIPLSTTQLENQLYIGTYRVLYTDGRQFYFNDYSGSYLGILGVYLRSCQTDIVYVVYVATGPDTAQSTLYHILQTGQVSPIVSTGFPGGVQIDSNKYAISAVSYEYTAQYEINGVTYHGAGTLMVISNNKIIYSKNYSIDAPAYWPGLWYKTAYFQASISEPIILFLLGSHQESDVPDNFNITYAGQQGAFVGFSKYIDNNQCSLAISNGANVRIVPIYGWQPSIIDGSYGKNVAILSKASASMNITLLSDFAIVGQYPVDFYQYAGVVHWQTPTDYLNSTIAFGLNDADTGSRKSVFLGKIDGENVVFFPETFKKLAGVIASDHNITYISCLWDDGSAYIKFKDKNEKYFTCPGNNFKMGVREPFILVSSNNNGYYASTTKNGSEIFNTMKFDDLPIISVSIDMTAAVIGHNDDKLQIATTRSGAAWEYASLPDVVTANIFPLVPPT